MYPEFKKELLNGKKMICPCCDRYAQVYRRRIYSTPAAQLILLKKLGGAENFIHSSRLVFSGATSVGDFAKAKYWELIEEKPNTDEDKNRSGFWRLTEMGFAFVNGDMTIPEFVYIFNDGIIDWSDKEVKIQDCLGEKYSYTELMAA